MGQILHRNARTTEAIRLEIHQSQESIAKLANKYHLNPKTIIRWKKRESQADLSTRHKDVHSTVLSKEEEAVCVAFRIHSQLPLDDCLYALQEIIPHLRRSSLHRLFKRNDISCLPKDEEKKAETTAFADYDMGFFHADITEVRTEEGKLYLFVGIDRISKYAYVELHHRMRKEESTAFLGNLIKNVPYKIHTLLTDNGAQFTNKQFKSQKEHEFDAICRENNIKHKLTKPYHPWTNGQVERMNRTIKEATVNKYYYKNEACLKNNLNDFIKAYNFGRRLKAIKGFTPVEFIAKKIGMEAMELYRMLYPNDPEPYTYQ
jgi:IS30 family transposase